ncbi:hypothetical protein, partial [Mannheimia haemolytica]
THSVLPENRIQLKPGSGVTLPLFADCHQLLTDEMKAEIDRVKRGENPEEMKAKIKADIEWEAAKAEQEPDIESEVDIEEDD